jgi:hypothetical protein
MAVPAYVLDLYPRDDPRDGALIRTLSPQKASWRDEANGTGSGRVAVRSTSADGQAFDPLGLDYIRVRDTANADRIVGGFFNDKARIKLLTKDSTKLLEVEGAGTLSYLARSVMAPHTYLDIAIGTDPLQGVWHLSLNGPAAGGGMLGAMLWRSVYEAQHFRVALTPHRHADGLIYTDSHDDDRLSTDVGIPDLVLGFDQFEDSDGNPWTLAAGEFKANVNDNLLTVVKRLMEAGLYVEMDPDTFELRAWEGTDHRRNRTSATWAVDKVRLQAPTDATIDTGNILSDADREVAAHVKRRTLYVGQGGTYVRVAGSTDIPWEGGVISDAEDPDALEQIGTTQLQARSDAGDTLKLRLKVGDDATQGEYIPWDDVRPDDLVTVHSGSDQWEYDEQAFPVAAVSINLRSASWETWIELGASFAVSDRRFQVAPVPAHNHGPNPELCRVGMAPDTPEVLDAYGLGVSGDSHHLIPSLVPADAGGLVFTMLASSVAPGGSPLDPPTSVTYQPRGAAFPAEWQTMTSLGSIIHNTAGTNTDLSALYAFWLPDPAAGDANARITWSGATQNGKGFGAWVTESSEEPTAEFARGVGTTASVVSAAGVADQVMTAAGFRQWSLGDASATPSALSGQTVDWASAANNAAGQADICWGGGHGTGGGTWSWSMVNSEEWLAVAISQPGTGGTTGDLPQDIAEEAAVGTSGRAARCDHVHAHGNLSPSETHHHGTAQIEGYTAPITDHGALTGLGDDDHPQYTTAAEVTDAMEALRWEAVTNGTDVFVWEGSDLVHEWKAY